MITGTPVVILSPFLFSYGLQYLGRVLVSSAMGESVPPHSPQRNFEGFFHGISPWFVWIGLGLGVGLMPVWWYAFFRGDEPVHLGIAMVLGLASVPYILAALMMSFLHDDPMAPKPWNVLLGLFRLGPSFWALCVFITMTVAVALGIFVLVVLLRGYLYWLYLPLSLGCWVVVHWTAVVVMRLLGTYYFHHKDDLRWHRAHPRWGVAWRL
jgi:hypothetical protein